jgi:hypothetical protein
MHDHRQHHDQYQIEEFGFVCHKSPRLKNHPVVFLPTQIRSNARARRDRDRDHGPMTSLVQTKPGFAAYQDFIRIWPAKQR